VIVASQSVIRESPLIRPISKVLTPTTYSALCDNVIRFAAHLIDDGVKPAAISPFRRRRLFLHSRPKRDLIIGGEYNVYPREIDEVLDEHPAVGEATVIGMLYGAVGGPRQ
jgi:hypothetical protein